MENKLRIPAIALLIINGISSCFSGFGLFMAPDGSSMHYSVEWLQSTPFDDFLIPGIILFIVVGLFSLAIAVLTFINHRAYPLLIIIEGCILITWLIIQVIMISFFHWIFAVYGIIAIALIIMGMSLKKQKAMETES